MRSKNRNFKKMRAVGLAGMLVAGLAAGSLPAEPVSAANGWEEDLILYAKSVTASSVTISIGSSGNATLSPGRGANGTALGTVKRTASVQLGATDGYTIKVSGNPDLTGNNASNKIASVSSATTLKQMSNQWGWYSAEGDVGCDESGTYRAMSTAGETISSGVLSSAATKTVTMCFGANVSTDQAADNYSNTVTVSAVAEPRTVVTSTKAFGGITYMQDMTVNACQNASVNETAQLIDRRDSKKYWVTKLLDGNCWMSQNLDLNIESFNIVETTSDVTSAWTANSYYKARVTSTSLSTGSFTDGSENHSNDTYSWDLGEYVIKEPTAIDACAGNNSGLSECSMFAVTGNRVPSIDPNFYRKTVYRGTDGVTECSKDMNTSISTVASGVCAQYDAHYAVGNYYQWNAATAGTGGSIRYSSSDVIANGSICPKNWKLPRAGLVADMGTGTFAYLLKQYGLATSYTAGSLTGTSSVNGDSYNLSLSPLFFMRSGVVQPASGGIYYAGESGDYWSATSAPPYGMTGYAYLLALGGSGISPSSSGGRHNGYAVRCFVPTA